MYIRVVTANIFTEFKKYTILNFHAVNANSYSRVNNNDEVAIILK